MVVRVVSDLAEAREKVRQQRQRRPGPNGQADGLDDEPASVPPEPEPTPSSGADPVDIFGLVSKRTTVTLSTELVPEVICEFAKAEAERLAVDPLVIAGQCLAVCSGLANDAFTLQIKMHDSYFTQNPRLWVVGIAPPGSRKSDLLNSAAAPAFRVEAALREEHAARCREWEARNEGKKKDEREAEPIEERVLCIDITIEKLGDLLNEKKVAPNRKGKLLLALQEAATLFGAFDKYNANSKVGSDRGHWLASYDGGPSRIDRVIRGSTFIPNWSTAIAAMIQPEKLAQLRGNLTSDGMLQRCTLFESGQADLDPDEDDDKPRNTKAVERYCEMGRTLYQLAPEKDTNGNFVSMRAREDAQPTRRAIRRLIQRYTIDQAATEALRNTAAKWSGLLPRLALTMQLIEIADAKAHAGIDPHRNDMLWVSTKNVERAAALIRKVIAPTAARFYSEQFTATGPAANARWLAGYILAHKLESISLRDIHKLYRALRGDREGTFAAMAILEDLGWTNRVNPIVAKWTVEPIVHERFAERAAEEKARREAIMKLIRETAGGEP